jgi:hypothetical protein
VLARLARAILVVALLAGWQAALAHSIEHCGEEHEETVLCDALDALTACSVPPVVVLGQPGAVFEVPFPRLAARRAAEAPPFLSQGPPAAVV